MSDAHGWIAIQKGGRSAVHHPLLREGPLTCTTTMTDVLGNAPRTTMPSSAPRIKDSYSRSLCPACASSMLAWKTAEKAPVKHGTQPPVLDAADELGALRVQPRTLQP